KALGSPRVSMLEQAYPALLASSVMSPASPTNKISSILFRTPIEELLHRSDHELDSASPSSIERVERRTYSGKSPRTTPSVTGVAARQHRSPRPESRALTSVPTIAYGARLGGIWTWRPAAQAERFRTTCSSIAAQSHSPERGATFCSWACLQCFGTASR